jgi:hypothetical protein
LNSYFQVLQLLDLLLSGWPNHRIAPVEPTVSVRWSIAVLEPPAGTRSQGFLLFCEETLLVVEELVDDWLMERKQVHPSRRRRHS